MRGQALPGTNPENVERMDRSTLVRHVRAWAEHRLKDTSIRQLAEEIGISKSALGVFVAGDPVPHKNWPKLRAWFLEDSSRERQEPQNAETMGLLTQELLANIPARERPAAFARLMAELIAIHREACAPRPAWLGLLAASAAELGREGEP